MENWKLLILKMDRPSKEAAKFFQRIWTDGIITKKIRRFVDYSKIEKGKVTNLIKEATEGLEGKILTIYGHGGYHHFTYGLCNVIAKKRSDNYAYLHIDNHSDAWYNSNGTLGCGSFSKNILEEPKAKKIIFFGNNYDSNEIFIKQESLTLNPKYATRMALKKLHQQDVYPSLDLDILSRTEINTGYDQGWLKLEHMLNIIKTIKNEKNMISADMLGYVKKYWFISPAIHSTSLLTYATLAAEITGKDTKELKKLHTYFKNKKSLQLSKKEFEKITEGLKI